MQSTPIFCTANLDVQVCFSAPGAPWYISSNIKSHFISYLPTLTPFLLPLPHTNLSLRKETRRRKQSGRENTYGTKVEQVIETFLTESGRDGTVWPDTWLLVRTPQQGITGPPLSHLKRWWPEKYHGWPDCPAIEPFTTGFLNWSVEEIGQFLHDVPRGSHGHSDRLYVNPPYQDVWTTWFCFVVLDERSAQDGTALVYDYHQRLPTEILRQDPDEEDENLYIDEWVEWRVKFMHAGHLASAMIVNGTQYSYYDWHVTKDRYFDEDGIWQFAEEERSWRFSNYPPELMVPFGPDTEPPGTITVCEEDWLNAVDQGLIKLYPGPTSH